MPDGSARRRHRPVAWTAGGLAFAVLLAGGVYAAQRASAGNALSDHYRVAVAALGDVTQQVSLTGSVTRVRQESVGFPAPGLIESVTVSVGQHVTAGQTLATMDPTGLNQAVLDAKAQLAQAQAAVVTDESAGSTAGPTGGTSPNGTPAGHPGSNRTAPSHAPAGGAGAEPASTGGPRRVTGPSGRPGGTSPTGSSGHTGVPASTLASIRRLSASVGTQVRGAGAAAQAEERACAPLLSGGSTRPTSTPRPPRRHTASDAAMPLTPGSTGQPTPAPATTPAPTRTPPPATGAPTPTSGTPPPATGTPTPTASSPVNGPQLAACLAAVRTATADVNRAASTLGRLSDLVGSATRQLHTSGSAAAARSSSGDPTAAAQPPAPDPPADPAPQGGPAPASSGGGTGGTGGTGRSSSGSSLAGDQAAVTQDQLSVTQAEQAAAGATLVSPISGVVGAVGITAGQDAASSSTITVVGAGAAQVTVQAPLSDLPSLAAGQLAQVAAAGGPSTLTGRVTQTGILPSSTGTSSPTYPVTVVVPDAPQALAAGSTAQITIATRRVTHVVTVPESALVMVGDGRARVQLISGRKVTDQVVPVGAIGQGRAQITSGLTAGQTVVLADLTQPLPANQDAAGGEFAGRGPAGGAARFPGRGPATP